MPLPLKKDRREIIDREIARLKAEKTSAPKDVERLIRRALIASIEADNGLAGAAERRTVLIDEALKRGLADSAIKDGPGMTRKLSDLLGGPASLDHAAGLLHEAAAMMAEAGDADANQVLAIANRINTADAVDKWRKVSVPRIKELPPAG